LRRLHEPQPVSRRLIADHELVEHRSAKPYRPYDRLVLRNPRGRTLWTALSCEGGRLLGGVPTGLMG